VVRRAEPDDYEAIWLTFQDEAAYAGTLQLPFASRELWRKRLAEFPEDDFFLVACIGGEIVGNAGLHRFRQARRAHAMHLGMAVRTQYTGRGVGSALMQAIVHLADEWLHVFRLELTVYTDNEPAMALYRKFGFVHEGTHKAYALRGGKYVDAHFMARVRPKAPI
jgi:putative acetyltransferase